MMFRRKISASVAIEIVKSSIQLLDSEMIKFYDASGRILADDIYALNDNPPFNRAAMDGYAVIASSTFYATPQNPVKLKKGIEAARIMTGKPIPDSFDAVVMIEYVEEVGDDEIAISGAVVPGENIAFKGEDVKQGDLILRKGKLLLPHDIGIIAAVGITSIPVYRSPVVGIISTGDEVVDPEDLDEDDVHEKKVADVNSFTLSALVSEAGGIPVRLGIVKDEFEALRDAIKNASGFDMLLVSGGSSVGDRDFIAAILDELGEVLFHGVAVKPGGPVGFGFLDRMPVFILPGYPVAAIVAFELFVRSALGVMQGRNLRAVYDTIDAKLLRKIPSQVGRLDFVRVKLEVRDGEVCVDPLGSGGSGSIGRMCEADGFLLIDEPLEGIDEGSTVKVYQYPRNEDEFF
ncbi:MAG: molybdopterin molybdotransferase MoeA [Candidatus Syntropharchaeales archaeon]